MDAASRDDQEAASSGHLDKAWYGIDCCLNHLVDDLHDPTLTPSADRCVFGGRPLTDGEDWIVTLWDPAEVRAAVAILAGVTEASMRRAYAA